MANDFGTISTVNGQVRVGSTQPGAYARVMPSILAQSKVRPVMTADNYVASGASGFSSGQSVTIIPAFQAGWATWLFALTFSASLAGRVDMTLAGSVFAMTYVAANLTYNLPIPHTGLLLGNNQDILIKNSNASSADLYWTAFYIYELL